MGHEEYMWVVPLAVLAAFFFGVLFLLRRNVREGRELHMRTELQKKILDRFNSPQELIEFLSSDAGRSLLSAQTANVQDRTLAAVQTGCVLAIAGSAVSSAGAMNSSMAILSAGVVVTGIGLGFFLAAGLSWKLASKWGMLTRR